MIISDDGRNCVFVVRKCIHVGDILINAVCRPTKQDVQLVAEIPIHPWRISMVVTNKLYGDCAFFACNQIAETHRFL